MISLPEKFLEDVKVILQDEYEEFIDSYNENKTTGLRLNTMKMSKEKFQKLNLFDLEQIPWTNEGFYYDESVCKPGKNPLHEAGVYYLQEPSAMSVVPKLDIQKGDRVLDMCAAPGGKSTYILSQLDDTGLLVSNEINPIRINALGENLERFGARNCIITNTDSTRLRKAFTGYFDKIVIDAPCSGEGMFRKDPVAIQDWTYSKVLECQSIQKEIIRDGYKMLKKGGILVYSTCTFSREENEDVIEEFIAENEGAVLIEKERLWPHKIKGEGHFVAKIQKLDDEDCRVKEMKLKKLNNVNLNSNLAKVKWNGSEIQYSNLSEAKATAQIDILDENVDLQNCKFIVNNNRNYIGIDDNSWLTSDAVAVTEKSGTVQTTIKGDNTYYIHLLLNL